MEEVVAVLGDLNVDAVVRHLRPFPLAAEGVQEVAGDPDAFASVPLEREGHERLEVRATLPLQAVGVLLPVPRVRAVCHLAVRHAGLPPVVEEDAVEPAQLGEARLPRPLHDHDARLLGGPEPQALEHDLGALDDDVELGVALLDAVRAVAAAEAHLQDAAAAVDAHGLDAMLHVRLLPLHHHLRSVHVQQLLLAVPVQGEEEAVRPVLELRAAAGGDARERP
mmetsp:Transcript_73118/g.191670  ORF Transcript_73118/g.191670 Transcript_73118/m.191670 type:complete len:223 (-) Transcript_73118:570-1238(-)